MPKTLDLDRHREIGADLHAMNLKLVALYEVVGNTYSPDSKVTTLAFQAQQSISRLRSELDDRVADESTRKEWDDAELKKVYYPDRAEK